MTVTAAELTKLVSNAVEAGRLAEEGDAAEQRRAVDVLKLLQKQIVTAVLLKDTDAGKKINKLAKSSDSTLAAAASQVVQAWKERIKNQQDGKTSSSSGPLPASGSQGALNRLQSNSSSGSLVPEAARKSKPPPASGKPCLMLPCFLLAVAVGMMVHNPSLCSCMSFFAT
jgi:transcription elongation factor S-II